MMRLDTKSLIGAVCLASAFALGVVFGAGVRPGVAASQVSALADRCSSATLDGPYGIKFDGDSSALGRFSSVSLWRFDGRGGLRAFERFSSENGGVGRRTIAGSYRLEADCTMTLLFPSELAKEHQAVGFCVVVDQGKEFFCLDVEEGWVATAVGKRV